MKLWRSLTAWRQAALLPAAKDSTSREILPEVGGKSLRLRLLFTVLIALAPAALVSIWQGYARVERDLDDVRNDLVQTARATAADEENIFVSAQQILLALANHPEAREGSPDCSRSLKNSLKDLSYFVNIARVSASGEIVCAAILNPGAPTSFKGEPWWSVAAMSDGFFITNKMYSPNLKREILGAVLPLRTEDQFDGVLALAADVSWLDFLLHANDIPAGAVAALFDRSGELIGTNAPTLATSIFGQGAQITKTGDGLIAAKDARGDAWSYMVAALPQGHAYVGLARRNADLFRTTYLHVATDLLLPVLMLGLASAAIWFATDRQVTRWILYLRRIATAYAHGHYAIRPVALEDAPSEFRMLGETFSGMASAVQDRDRRLREALAQKTLLIKETHHRVKNNLQIVMSLLSLQAKQLRDPGAQNALKQAQVRVNALALVHRILNEIEDLGAVDLTRLLNDLAEQIHEGFGAERRDLRMELNITPRLAPGDLAVPLTLFLVEALTNAFKHAYPVGARGGVIRVSLLPIAQGRLRLTVADDGSGLDGEPSQTGIGSRLIQAFAKQIGGTASVVPRPGGGTIVTLDFDDPQLDDPQTEQKAQESIPESA